MKRASNAPEKRISMTIRIREKVKKEGQERAEELGRSLSNYIEALITKDCREREDWKG